MLIQFFSNTHIFYILYYNFSNLHVYWNIYIYMFYFKFFISGFLWFSISGFLFNYSYRENIVYPIFK
jgi:hypothetical protein